MKSLVSFPRYEGYKESGVDWIGDVPEHWMVYPLCFKTKLKSISNTRGEELLSVYLDKGVIRFDEIDAKRTNVTSLDLSKYQLVEPGDLVLNNQQAWRGSVGVSKHRGIVSPAYLVLSFSVDVNSSYANYLFRDNSMVTHYLTCSKGVGTIQRNLYWPQLKRVPVFLPTFNEQVLISTFLNQKTAQIDQAIDIKKKQIELLKERQQVVIQQAVTKGLDPAVRMRDSGVEWIGEVPEHWEVKKLKYLLDEINIRSTTGAEVLLSLSKYHGVIPRNTLEERAGGAESLIGYKHVAKEDLVINKMQAVTGLLAVSKLNGITSPDYSVYRSKNIKILNINYLGYLLSLPEYLGEFKKRVTGVMEGFIRLYTDDLYSISVVLPSVEAQVAIVRFLSDKALEVDKAVALLKKQIHTLQEYKSSLINSAVTGKIKITTDMIATEE